jgi:phosphoribosylformimino-5-aminoimidazole carboxamide ribotide isomerase
MQLYPAIDLRGGHCVRLKQGDYAQETLFDTDPVAAARRWERLGAHGLHLVDLDGAKQGRPVNGHVVRRIRTAVKIPIQIGGGLRDDSHVETAFSWGAERVIIGTKALSDPAWLRSVCERHPGRIILGLDARAGMVATHGWLETSEHSAVDVARRAAAWPLAAIVYTDIAKDGMMGGPNVEALAELAAAVAVPVIASGGITTVDDVKKLAQLNLAGCIIGRALYEGKLDLTEALRAIA